MLSSACLTKCDTSPGLAPCVSTAVGGLLPRAQGERLEAHAVVAALLDRGVRVGVASRPGLDAGVQIHRAVLRASRDERDARDVHRDIEQEIARAEQRLERASVVLAGQRAFTNLTPYFAASACPASSAVTMVMRSGEVPM